MEWPIFRNVSHVITSHDFQVGRAVGSGAFQDGRSIDSLARNCFQKGIHEFPVTPDIIKCDAPPPSGQPLPLLWCFRFYATIVPKWDDIFKVVNLLVKVTNTPRRVFEDSVIAIILNTKCA